MSVLNKSKIACKMSTFFQIFTVYRYTRDYQTRSFLLIIYHFFIFTKSEFAALISLQMADVESSKGESLLKLQKVQKNTTSIRCIWQGHFWRDSFICIFYVYTEQAAVMNLLIKLCELWETEQKLSVRFTNASEMLIFFRITCNLPGTCVAQHLEIPTRLHLRQSSHS